LKPWSLSPKQLAAVNSALCRDRDVILVSYQSYGDFPATLAHEICHHINHRLGVLKRSELYFKLFSPVIENMRRVARFDEYFYQNTDEYYAETWARFLCGKGSDALLRYLEKPRRHLRKDHLEKAQLIEDHRKRVVTSS
jgi:hypothetical protein